MKVPGPGRDRNFFIAGTGLGSEFFSCRDRGRAGISNFFVTGAGAGPGSKIKNDRGRGRAGNGKIENAEAGPGSDFFLLPEPRPGFKYFIAGTGIFLLPGPGLDLNSLLPGLGPGRD